MDAAKFEEWLNDRSASDDELDVLLEQQMIQLEETARRNDKLMEILARKHGGSRIGRGPNVKHDHALGHQRIWQDYFAEDATYPSHLFRRRFRMRKPLFLKIHDSLLEACPYFVQRPDAVGNVGLSSIQKMTAAMRLFTLGIAGDAVDEYVRIGESTAHAAFKNFVEGIVRIFGDQYLRAPTEDDVRKQMEINRARGFVGMFGSLDCTHWNWKNCPVAYQGQYRDKDGENSIVLEAVATANLWIWHAFIGIPGSNNDINVIDRSPLIVNLLNGVAPDVNFTVNGHEYQKFYFLCDGIYPDYTVFMKTSTNPQGAKRKWFAKRQESVRKDVERCFGVLKARFAMIRNPSHWWKVDEMITIWHAAVIMHNMIIEDEESSPELNHDYLFENAEVRVNPRPRPALTFTRLTYAVDKIKDTSVVTELKNDLVEHLWKVRGDEDDD